MEWNIQRPKSKIQYPTSKSKIQYPKSKTSPPKKTKKETKSTNSYSNDSKHFEMTAAEIGALL